MVVELQPSIVNHVQRQHLRKLVALYVIIQSFDPRYMSMSQNAGTLGTIKEDGDDGEWMVIPLVLW